MTASDSPRIDELRRRWEADPSSRIYLQLADEYLKQGELAEAARVLRRGLDERPSDLSGQVALGRCLVELGEAEEAAGRLESVLEKDPAHIVANKLLIRAYLASGRAEPARERLEIHRLLDDRDEELDELEVALERVGKGREGSLPSTMVEEDPRPSDVQTAPPGALELPVADEDAEDELPPATTVETDHEDLDFEAESFSEEEPAGDEEVFVAPPRTEAEDGAARAETSNRAAGGAPPVASASSTDFDSETDDGPFALSPPWQAAPLPDGRARRAEGERTPFPLNPADWQSVEGEDVFGLGSAIVAPETGPGAFPETAAEQGRAREPEMGDPAPARLEPVFDAGEPELDEKPVLGAEADGGVVGVAENVDVVETEVPDRDVPGESSAGEVEDIAAESVDVESVPEPQPAIGFSTVFARPEELPEPEPSEQEEEPAPDSEGIPSSPATEEDEILAEEAGSPEQLLEAPPEEASDRSVEAPSETEDDGAEAATSPPLALATSVPEPPDPVGEVSESEPPTSAAREPESALVPKSEDMVPEAGSERVGSLAEMTESESPESADRPAETAEVSPDEPTVALPGDLAHRYDEELAAESAAASESTSGTPRATATLGELYLRQGHLDEAAEIFQAVLDRNPGSTRARWGLRRVAAARPAEIGADRLLARSAELPSGLTDKKVQVLGAYLDHLRQGEGKNVH